MDTDDILILPLPMGPHARASYRSRMQALKEYGINPAAIDIADNNRHIAQEARHIRENILSGNTHTIAS